MNQVVLQSLQQISTGYSVFEKDQVLTHSQLNTVAEYFDDQTRLTRTKLLGVGIVCGLRVTTDGDSVTVSKGAGITTDGDLLYLPADTVFEQYKLYDEANPTYPPFASAISAKKIYEWRPAITTKEKLTETVAKASGNQAISAGQLGGGIPPRNNMVAVLFMEEYVKDEDICTGTDCDNLGQNFVSNIKLLLVDKSVVGPLRETVPTPDQAARVLTDIVADRPLFSSTANSPAKIAAIYKTACQSINQKLIAQLQKLYPTCRAFLGDAFLSDPTSGWITRLNGLATTFPTSLSGIQYYYDFLRDLVETYNDFRRLLFGDKTWCCPDTDSFPKHLLLGNVVAPADSETNRTGFYPSFLSSHTTDRLKHARFLARKLSTLIGTFKLPPFTSPIRITPTRFGEVPLEERAIPYYYDVNSASPIEKQWSYRLHQQGMDAWNYSYNAAAYGAQGGAAHPLTSQMGGFSFFRIEGHQGQHIADAKAAIEAEIKKNNLPFVVQPVLLGTDRTRVIMDIGVHYTDLHSLHHILRNDLITQLDDVKTFSAHYVDEVNKPAADSYVSNISQLRSIAADADAAIKDETAAAKGALGESYVAYRANPTAWKSSVKTTMNNVALFKKNLADVTQTEFTTPFDSFIASSSAHWLDWLDIIIQDNDTKNVEKLLYANFQALHPGLEHFAGVVRGGTFVLAYDTNNVVVADFMLPYHCCKEAPQTQPKEPVLPRPPIKSETALAGIKITPEIQTFVGTRLDKFTHVVIDPKLLSAKETELAPAGKTRVVESVLGATVTETKVKRPKTKQPKVKSRKTKRKQASLDERLD
jgi:hypothetical protein